MNALAPASVVRRWLPIALATSVLAFGGLLAWHQQLRQAADEPQRSLAHDAALAIAAGQGPERWMPPPIALETGEGLFLAAYDTAGRPLWSSASLHGALPSPPGGVFAQADGGEHRLSWQPAPGVREALVIVPMPGRGYLLAGRSLHEAEARKAQVLPIWVGAWLLALLLSLAAMPRRLAS